MDTNGFFHRHNGLPQAASALGCAATGGNKSMANLSRNMSPKPCGKYVKIWHGTSGEDLGPVWNQNSLVRNVHAYDLPSPQKQS